MLNAGFVIAPKALIVDGDVVADITLLEDRKKFLAVIQDGVLKAGRLAPRRVVEVAVSRGESKPNL